MRNLEKATSSSSSSPPPPQEVNKNREAKSNLLRVILERAREVADETRERVRRTLEFDKKTAEIWDREIRLLERRFRMAAALAVIGLSGCTVAQRTEVESAGHEFSVDADVDEPVELPEAHTICVNSSIDRLQQLIFTLARGGD